MIFQIGGPPARQIADARLGRRVGAEGELAFRDGCGRVQYDGGAVGQQRQRLPYHQDHALEVGVEGLVVLLFRDGPEAENRVAAGVGEGVVDPSLLFLYLRVDAIQVAGL
ncbi:hypothetical protein P0D75_00610 [Paraburkholderia sediminicola]